MSSQLNSLKRLTPYAPIAIAAIAGLILGLLVGWVWWPVTWTSALVTDLDPAARAAYISAVADAYTLDGSQSTTVRMQQRLAPFGEDLPTVITEAMQYYQNDPAADSVVLGNIGRLATDLGVPVDASMMAAIAGEGAADPAAAAAAAESAPAADANPSEVVPAAESNEGGAGVLTWVLAVLASLALIGGGVYLLMRLRNRELPDSLTGPSPVPPLPASNGGSGPAQQRGAPSRTSAWVGGAKADPANELSFDDEEDEEPAVRFGSLPGDDPSGLDPDDPDADPDTGDEGDSDADADEDFGPPRYSSARGPAGGGGGEGSPPVYDLTARDTPPADLDSFASRSSYGPSNYAQSVGSGRAPARSAEAVVAPPAPARGAPIVSHTFQFLAGMPDYIEALNINDPATGRFVGEYGMGISSKNRALHNNPDQVIALEVWMYDKLDARDNVNMTRVLLSEYAIDRDFDQAFLKERDGQAKTLPALPQSRFELDGRNLVLEGEITDVLYDRDGIFRSATVEMSVYAKK